MTAPDREQVKRVLSDALSVIQQDHSRDGLDTNTRAYLSDLT